MAVDYILEINLRKCKKKKLLMVLSSHRCRRDKSKTYLLRCINNKKMTDIFVVLNGYRALLTLDAIIAVHCFQMLTAAFSKMLVQTII